MERSELVLFVARADCEEEGWQEFLNHSLSYTRAAYVNHYGPLSEELPFLVFAQSSTRKFASDTVPSTIAELLATGKETGLPVVIVMNGWDGLTTNPVVMFNLFGPWINDVDISLRVFAGEPRTFFGVSVVHVIEALRGDHDDDEAPDLPYDTQLFLDKFHALHYMGITGNLSPPSAAAFRQ
ncbi:hypothetical protein ANOM_005208 [Aspergillus nomiae NRRL 13137]|uniref:Uncharacterized protein n=1 Tax=Aspergillus nomiae NRRL (strain ATCC 15546 / NRRL 13137 / CBS 260.88 / M93) TaxID=1509407 RepID=A0A0L1J3Q3_ASPN3|nr:uncharacterized protein ANOM_005208 [Aspergillus nomiae NRRL 13137]KNG86305.1 hypothetical protein ANOM_005208 [Aspergillus nomiae NRRL 13137]